MPASSNYKSQRIDGQKGEKEGNTGRKTRQRGRGQGRQKEKGEKQKEEWERKK